MVFSDVQGVTVTGNTQRLSSGKLATFPGSSNVTYKHRARVQAAIVYGPCLIGSR